MANFVTNILLLILGCAFYSSGLLLWPIRRWLSRKRKIHGKALGFLFLTQAATLPIFIFMGTFYSNLLDVGYGWALLWIELNVLFTVVGIFAWIRDARFERNLEVNRTA